MSNPKVRLRFAPSPTGSLHVGGLRTALYNYLFAVRHKGKLILRIEDTDQKREVKDAAQSIIEDLNWSGIHFDEGPHIKDSSFGPYWQSDRLEIYKKYWAKLIEQHDAYYCFCSSETLANMRSSQMKRKQSPRYDGRCRRLSFAEAHKKLADGEPYVIRMKIKQTRQKFVFHDLIRGEVAINAKQIDDQVLIKSDGYPTYHFANVVDDHLMGITHVIRGEEWLSSVPKHILLYEYFNWQVPQFAHLPLLLNTDRSKLSKRQGDVRVEDYKSNGYLNQGLMNFIALLGWSNNDNREIFSLEELKHFFSLENINKAGAIFDVTKLDWVNQQHIQLVDSKYLDEEALNFYPPVFKSLPLEKRLQALDIVKPGISKLIELKSKLLPFIAFETGYFSEKISNSAALLVISCCLDLLKEYHEQDTKISNENFKKVIQEIAKRTGKKGKEVFGPLRILLTNLEQGPELYVTINFYGLDFVIKKMGKFIQKMNNLKIN